MKLVLLLIALLAVGGCNLKAAIEKSAPSEEDVAKPADPRAGREPAEQKRDKGIIGKMTDEVADYEKAMAENPQLVEVKLKAGGSDYVSFLASSYIATRSQVSTLGMQHAVRAFDAEHDRNPTHAEMMKIMKENGVKFTMLPRYQRYAYHSKEGRFAVLEDPAKKAEIHGTKPAEN